MVLPQEDSRIEAGKSKGSSVTMSSSTPRNIELGNERRLVSIMVLCDTFGVSRQTIYDWLSKNRYGISEYCVLVKIKSFGIKGEDGSIRTYEEKKKDREKKSSRQEKYYFYEEFLSVFLEKASDLHFPRFSIPSEYSGAKARTNSDLVDLYFKILVIIEDRLTEEEKSIATEQQRWLDMKLVDVEIVGHIFYWYRETYGDKLTENEKEMIRNSINHHFFNNARLREVVYYGMLDMLKAISEKEEE